MQEIPLFLESGEEPKSPGKFKSKIPASENDPLLGNEMRGPLSEQILPDSLPIPDKRYSNPYQSFIRWFAREDILQKFCVYALSESFQHSQDAGFLKKLKSNIHFLARAASFPQSSPQHLRRMAYITAFFEGTGILTEKLWPTVLAALLAHDGITYFTQPLDRYGNKLEFILGGISPNQLTWSTQLGSDLAGGYVYWVAPGLLLGSFLSGGIYKLLRRYFQLNGRKNEPFVRKFDDLEVSPVNSRIQKIEDKVEKVHSNMELLISKNFSNGSVFSLLWDKNLFHAERSRRVSKIRSAAIDGNWIEKFLTLSALGKIADSFDENTLKLADIKDPENFKELSKEALEGINHQIDNFSLRTFPQYLYAQYLLWSLGRSNNIASHLLFPLLILYVWYSKARIVEILYFKGKGAYEYFRDKRACENQNKIWLLIEAEGNYKCVVCDWPFVYYSNLFTSQGCLDGLLAQPRTAQEILNYIDVVLKHPDFNEIDFSNQNWRGWTESELSAILNKFSGSIQHLKLLNLSQPFLNPIFPDDLRVQDLIEFLKRVPVQKLDLDKLGMGDERMTRLITEALKNNSLTYLDVSSNKLTASSGDHIHKLTPKLETLKAANNPFGDEFIEKLSAYFSNSTLSTLDVSNTDMSEEGAQALAAALPRSRLRQLDLSENNLSLLSSSFWQAIGNTTLLEEMDLSETQLDDGQAALTAYVSKAKLNVLHFSGNPFTDQGMFLIVQNTQNSTISSIYFNRNFLTNKGLALISTVLSKTPLQTLGIANCKSFTPQGLGKLVVNLPNVSFTLDLSGNDLGNKVAKVFGTVLNGTKNSIKTINLSENRLTDEAGMELVRLFSQAESLKLDRNYLTGRVIQVLADIYTNTTYKELGFSENLIEGSEGIIQLAPQIPGSALQRFSLAGNQIEGEAGVILANI
jgi:Ran GTPase-activating protein (RanGAP) involved in mRNA processing and transport